LKNGETSKFAPGEAAGKNPSPKGMGVSLTPWHTFMNLLRGRYEGILRKKGGYRGAKSSNFNQREVAIGEKGIVQKGESRMKAYGKEDIENFEAENLGDHGEDQEAEGEKRGPELTGKQIQDREG
jgi:hypothetical protein